MQTIHAIDDLRRARSELTGKVAFVPTMGALHDGHLSLIRTAWQRADHVIASIFVNPMQFGKNEDLSRYPRQEAADAAMLANEKVDVLWLPGVETMYPDGFATTVSVAELGKRYCGAIRPGHFDGVATVVAKLFNQVRPDIALFGEKDWQQLAIIRRMTVDLNLPIEIVGVPTAREADGLAMSSRNAYLTSDERQRASALPNALASAVSAIQAGQPVPTVLSEARTDIERAGFTIDYLVMVDENLQSVDALSSTGKERLLVAARIGKTRLIDNMSVR